MGLEDNQRAVKVTGEPAMILSDLASLHYDFESASRFFQEYADVPDDERNPESAQQALWIAGVTLYGRAVSKGVRHSARARTDVYSIEQTATHDFVLITRNKFVAHSANGFEQGNVFAIVEGRTASEMAIAGVGSQHTRLAGLGGAKATAVVELCATQMRDLRERSVEVQRTIAKQLIEQGADFVLGLEELGMPDIDETRAARDRPRT